MLTVRAGREFHDYRTGGEATVAYGTIMHHGMEGPHLFLVTVPVRGSDGAWGELEAYVRAHFD